MDKIFVTKLESLSEALRTVTDQKMRDSLKRLSLSSGSLTSLSVAAICGLLYDLENSPNNTWNKLEWLNFMHSNTLISTNCYSTIKPSLQ